MKWDDFFKLDVRVVKSLLSAFYSQFMKLEPLRPLLLSIWIGFLLSCFGLQYRWMKLRFPLPIEQNERVHLSSFVSFPVQREVLEIMWDVHSSSFHPTFHVPEKTVCVHLLPVSFPASFWTCSPSCSCVRQSHSQTQSISFEIQLKPGEREETFVFREIQNPERTVSYLLTFIKTSNSS